MGAPEGSGAPVCWRTPPVRRAMGLARPIIHALAYMAERGRSRIGWAPMMPLHGKGCVSAALSGGAAADDRTSARQADVSIDCVAEALRHRHIAARIIGVEHEFGAIAQLESPGNDDGIL